MILFVYTHTILGLGKILILCYPCEIRVYIILDSGYYFVVILHTFFPWFQRIHYCKVM